MWAPRQGPQPGVPIIAPARTRASRTPEERAWRKTSLEAGMTRVRAFTSLPFRIRAATSRSSRRPLVQVPMKTWSTSVPARSPTGRTWSTRKGTATWGERSETSNSISAS